MLFAQECTASESSDALKGAQTETEKALSKVRSIEVRAAEREADLKDRIRVLEERLVLLTEPDSALFSEQMEQAKLSTSTAIPSDETPEAVATRCATLLVEVLHSFMFPLLFSSPTSPRPLQVLDGRCNVLGLRTMIQRQYIFTRLRLSKICRL